MTVIVRESKETQIRLAVTHDDGEIRVDTGEPFLDHMLVTLARYAGVGLDVQARGDLRHHLIEDVGIAMGAAVAAFAPRACRRYGERTIPMDEAVVQVVLDIGGRPFYRGPVPSPLYDHFFRSLSDNAGCTLHIRVLRGRDRHHVVEAAFKAFGLALRDALVTTDTVFSTKGSVRLEVTE
jgi:imidazoleglycerol-phosphate dehydratase